MNLLFDLDGTLTDPALGITRCLAHACESVGAPVPSSLHLKSFIGPPLQETLQQILGTDDPVRLETALVAYRERFSSIGMFENTVYPGISATLDTLQSAGHPLWVATSKPRVFADRIIDHFALRPYFRRVYGSELDGTRSAKADLLGYLLQHESLDPAYTVMIGDREHDIVGARTAGIAAIGVTWGYGSRAELLAASPATVVDQPLELMAAVRGMQRTGAR